MVGMRKMAYSFKCHKCNYPNASRFLVNIAVTKEKILELGIRCTNVVELPGPNGSTIRKICDAPNHEIDLVEMKYDKNEIIRRSQKARIMVGDLELSALKEN